MLDYILKDFKKHKYLDGVMCQFSIHETYTDQPIAYVFDRDIGEAIVKYLNERKIN